MWEIVLEILYNTECSGKTIQYFGGAVGCGREINSWGVCGGAVGCGR